MPGAHSYVQYSLLTNSTLNHGPGSMDSAGKRVKVTGEPAHGPPLQARVVAANRTVRTTCDDDPGAHGNEQGAKQSKIELNGGQKKMSAAGMAWQRRAGTHSLQN